MQARYKVGAEAGEAPETLAKSSATDCSRCHAPMRGKLAATFWPPTRKLRIK